MSRLPTVGGDTDNWGSVLNDYLTKSAGGTAALAAATSVGATTLDLAAVPSGVKAGAVIAVDAYTTQCELVRVASVAGNTVTISPYRLMFAHASGDAVQVLENIVTPQMFGLVGDTTDEWVPLQRLFREATIQQMKIKGENLTYYFQQPLLINTSSYLEKLNLRTRTGFTPVEANGASIMVGNGVFFFTAIGATNVFTSTDADYVTPAAHGMTNDIPIAFNAPYGETLPTGLTAGKVYYVKTTPTSSTFTVSATVGGTTLDITTDGSGWSMNNPGDGLARVHWDGLFLTNTIVDLHGMRMALQQPAWTRNTRIDMNAAATVESATIGWILTGQQSGHDNIEANTWNNVVGMEITGTGHLVRGFNSVGNGPGAGQTALKVAGDSCGVSGIWTESHTRASIEVADLCRGLLLEGPWVIAHQSAGIPCLLVTGNQTSYEVGIMRHTSGVGLFVSDTSARSFEIDLSTDVFNGLTQAFGNVPPILKVRSSATGITTTPYTLTSQIEFLAVNTAGGNKTVNLPAAAGTAGLTFTITNAPDSGSNTVTIDANASELIDLATTKVLDPYEAVTLLSDGSRWLIVSERIP